MGYFSCDDGLSRIEKYKKEIPKILEGHPCTVDDLALELSEVSDYSNIPEGLIQAVILALDALYGSGIGSVGTAWLKVPSNPDRFGEMQVYGVIRKKEEPLYKWQIEEITNFGLLNAALKIH